MFGDSPLSVTDASGRQVSLLNGEFRQSQELCSGGMDGSSKRKYHCTEPGCNKSFTTSGHLARHNRIHTGEKNFPCFFPGCQSRFSRQDNMMQHYRTHMSPKSRRTQKRSADDQRPRPRLHAHHRIKSDPIRVEQPLTIDQHLSNYHRSLISHAANLPPPLISALSKNSAASTPLSVSPTSPAMDGLVCDSSNDSHAASPSMGDSGASSHDGQSSHASMYGTGYPASHPTSPSSPHPASTTSSQSSIDPPSMFYQYRPLSYVPPPSSLFPTDRPAFPSTLLHPEPLSSTSQTELEQGSRGPADDDATSNSGLLQLAHIVSTFG